MCRWALAFRLWRRSHRPISSKRGYTKRKRVATGARKRGSHATLICRPVKAWMLVRPESSSTERFQCRGAPFVSEALYRGNLSITNVLILVCSLKARFGRGVHPYTPVVESLYSSARIHVRTVSEAGIHTGVWVRHSPGKISDKGSRTTHHRKDFVLLTGLDTSSPTRQRTSGSRRPVTDFSTEPIFYPLSVDSSHERDDLLLGSTAIDHNGWCQ